ncbi:hypothetical protein OJF2_01460 [Aquisphaera giovannonii]|uniref:DUF1559 domain-containing protein n=1 Tax=Aquisphaera giovannonii TaxID=406548 RepID=A0A5B9VV46_9BACT|nr:DUF1559 domain-containing protein [Aquisphaera giovannonii]QEH31681.1 hypothetical protein OJF2_01460 [Aquisphaera giovannonii]
MSTTFDHDPEFGGTIRKPEAGPGVIARVLRTLGCLGVIVLGIMLLSPAYRSAREAARRAACVNNLKQIALAMHNYAEEHGAFPPACTLDANGRRLHSWRVLLLPYLELEAFYKTIDLSKPWDDPANAKAAERMPSVYNCSASAKPNHTAEPFERFGNRPDNTTTYLANAAEGGLLRRGKPRRPEDVIDGLMETLMVIEADDREAVPWMAPIDADATLILGLSPDSKLAHPGGMNAAFCDGSVRFLKATLAASTRRAMITIDAGDGPHVETY